MAWAVWVTGLPGSGKTTVAGIMAGILRAKGLRLRVLGVDDVRRVLTPQPTYSLEEREIVYGAIALMAELLTEEGVSVIIDATGNLRRYREKARRLIPGFAEIYVKCPIAVARRREEARVGGNSPADIYRKGATGMSSTVPGVNVAYEEPEAPLATLDTAVLSAEAAAALGAEAVLARFGDANE